MRKAIFSLLLLITSFAALSVACGNDSGSTLATVSVGSEIITLDVTEDYVREQNAIGDSLGYGRDILTDLSFYWVELEILEFDDGVEWRGIVISLYAAQGLRQLIEKGQHDLAYDIAQMSFDKLQEDYWLETGHELTYPLKFR